MGAPTAADLEANPVVQAAFAAAWADSFVDDPQLRHEEGGYIYCEPATGDVRVRRAPPGSRRLLDLSRPPVVLGCFLVATYHTHPNLIADGGDPDPSDEDRLLADDSGIPWFVVSELGVYAVGPARRVGGLTGPPGYPNPTAGVEEIVPAGQRLRPGKRAFRPGTNRSESRRPRQLRL